MQKWTLQDLERIAPRPGRAKGDSDERHAARSDAHAGYLHALVDEWDQLVRADMATPLRLAHFIAQAAHETGGFTIVREDTRWSLDNLCSIWPHRFKRSDPVFMAKYATCRGNEEALAELVYGHKVRPDLGNCEPDDGWLYRGGGMFQGTGRSWYREAGQAIGVDLEAQPDLIEDPRVSLAAAIWWWKKHGLNRFADKNFGRAIGNAINRGNPYSSKEPIGVADRKRWFDRAWAVLGNGALPAPEVTLGAANPDVSDLQQRLHDLGYPCGACDGIFGHETGRALAAFKRDWTTATGLPLEPGDAIGPATKAALAAAEPVKRPEREALTPADLAASGSTEVAAGKSLQRWGRFLGIGGGMALAEQTSTTPAAVRTLNDNLGWLPGFKSGMIPVLEAMAWGFRNLLPLLLILGAVVFWTRGRQWIWKRVEAARRGLNLSR